MCLFFASTLAQDIALAIRNGHCQSESGPGRGLLYRVISEISLLLFSCKRGGCGGAAGRAKSRRGSQNIYVYI